MSNEQGRVVKITIPDLDRFTIPQFENEFSRILIQKNIGEVLFFRIKWIILSDLLLMKELKIC